MNRPLPHIGPTLGQRQAMRYAQVDRAAVLQRLTTQNAVLATEQAHEEARQLAAVALRPEPAAFVAANDDESTEPSWFAVLVICAIDVAITVTVLALMAAFGLIAREPVRHALVWLGVMS